MQHLAGMKGDPPNQSPALAAMYISVMWERYVEDYSHECVCVIVRAISSGVWPVLSLATKKKISCAITSLKRTNRT